MFARLNRIKKFLIVVGMGNSLIGACVRNHCWDRKCLISADAGKANGLRKANCCREGKPGRRGDGYPLFYFQLAVIHCNLYILRTAGFLWFPTIQLLQGGQTREGGDDDPLFYFQLVTYSLQQKM